VKPRFVGYGGVTGAASGRLARPPPDRHVPRGPGSDRWRAPQEGRPPSRLEPRERCPPGSGRRCEADWLLSPSPRSRPLSPPWARVGKAHSARAETHASHVLIATSSRMRPIAHGPCKPRASSSPWLLLSLRASGGNRRPLVTAPCVTVRSQSAEPLAIPRTWPLMRSRELSRPGKERVPRNDLLPQLLCFVRGYSRPRTEVTFSLTGAALRGVDRWL